MKAKDIAEQLGNLANSAGFGNGYESSDLASTIPDELQEPEPIFTVEHDEILEKNEKRALTSVQYIVNTIVPESYQLNPIIKDKIKQDAEQLGQLYYQQAMNNIMIKVIMDTISKGDTSAKIFDSYTKLMSIAKDFNKQINEMQNQFRKYYIDTYLDLQHKEEEDTIITNTPKKTLTSKKQQTIEYIEDNKKDEEELDRIETSTRDSTLKIQEWKRQQFKKQYEKIKDTDKK